MKDLIARLEQAPEGSRELDAEIHCLITPGRIVHPKSERGYTQDDLLHKARNAGLAQSEFISRSRGPSPHYTASVDAKLPGENIVQVKAPGWNSVKPPGMWEAACATSLPGQLIYGYGHTEALARRIAALKAHE